MLSGNLELFALADVLRFVARSGATGAVNIYRDVDGGRILLVDGEVVGAVVDDTAAPDADGVVDTAMRLMDGGGGDFALELEPAGGPTRLTVEDFLKAVGRRRAEWSKILGSLGSLDGALEVTALVPSGSAEITLTPLEWHMAVLADGRRSLREIASEAGASEFAAATALLAMSNAGLLTLPRVPESSAHHAENLHDEDDDHVDDEDGFGFEDEAPEAPDASEAEASDEDADPAELLRELGGQRPARPRGRRLAPATREEQRIHLRSR
ncbi:MAG: DUF4388 domain-containing protein [Actinomycetota bacterium]